jgi:hypothetical protein
MRTNCSCTVYNRYVVDGIEYYQHTYVYDVAWEDRKQINTLATGGNISTNSARAFIPLARGKNYLKPKAWGALITKTGKWTLAEGDYVVKGLVADEIHYAVVSPPTAAFLIVDLKSKYDDVFQISSVDTMDAGSQSMHHWNVGLK